MNAPFRGQKTKEAKGILSGKKKRHTQKNTIITNKRKRILYLASTVEGKKHDYKAFKEEFPSSTLSAKLLGVFSVYADLGYLGIEKEYSYFGGC
ncbi:hypothetical protein H5T87_01355 [bacterium]|nr:hypothetical protein [bacterium]